MLKNYYQLPKSAQWIVAILLFGGGLAISIPLLIKPYGILIFPLMAPFFNLVSVPFFRLIGYYKYLNPYVLSTIQTDKEYDLHNIFTFDYLIRFKWSDRGSRAQRILLGHYLKALVTIIERIESGTVPPEVKIVGHSYFFSERSARKFGFTISKASSFWVFNSVLQGIELSCLYSFSQGRLAIPKLWDVKRAEISGADLVKQKATLETLSSRILQDL